jgi:phage anti-repressor protein
MKNKSNGMSPDMLHDATSSTPIPVFTSINEGTKNESQNLLQKETEGNPIQNELIRIDFDKQTVSARALYDFLELAERFSKWFQRMISYGLVENDDFTVVPFWVTYTHKWTEDFKSVPNGTDSVLRDIGDYLLTIDAAKHIAMVQRNEKGKQARNYFINIEKLYLKNLYSNNQTDATLIEKIRKLIIEHDGEMVPQKDYNLLAEKMVVLEQKLDLHHLKEEYIERTISKKIDMAVKASFREADQISSSNEIGKRLPHRTNPNSVVALNQLEKTIQKTTLEEDLVLKWFRPSHRKADHSLFLTATDITARFEWFSKRVTVRNVGMALKKFGFERVPHSQKGGKVKGYFVIEL